MDRLDHLTTESEKRTTESERRINILEFVKERQRANKNTNKTTVIKYLKEKGLSSRETSLDLINDLIREGKLNKKEINSQVHFLTLNQDNEFIKIYNYLSEIENVLDEIRDPVEYICQYSMGEPDPDPTKSEEWYQEKADFFGELRRACLMPIQRLLDFLFILSNRVIQSEKDSQIITGIIVDLYLKLMEVFYFKNVFDSINSYLEEDISYLDSLLKDARFHKYTNETEISIDLVNNFLGKIKEFSKQFLTDTDKKIEEPHKKSD
jgi:hypothetical protein